MIRLATIQDLREIKSLTEACALALQQRNIFQWNENYPSREKLLMDISRRELYVYEENNTIVGIVVLTSQMDKEYLPIRWLINNKNNLYVHRLATFPEVWGSGYGRKLMDFAESFARSNGYSSVRLDTFSQNNRNQKFYEKRGYKKVGDIFFPYKSEYPFYCYERIMD